MHWLMNEANIARRAAASVLVVAAVASLLLLASTAGAFRNVKPGEAIPAFTLDKVGGGSVGLGDVAGKPKIIVFFSGNDRSKKVLETLGPLYEKYKGDGLEVVAIYSGSDKNEAQGMADETKPTFPVLLDLDRQAYGDYGIMVTPVMAFVDKDDKLLKEQAYVPLLEGILDIEARVALGKLSREDADLSLKPEEAPEVSSAEKEAQKTYNLGLVLLERGMKDKAVEKFQETLKIDPTFCKVRLQLGQLYLEGGKVDEAKAEFDYVLKCDPQSHEAKVGMGSVFALQGDYDKAIEILESSVMLNPRPELAYYELGKVYEKKQELEKAVENYKKALEKLLAD